MTLLLALSFASIGFAPVVQTPGLIAEAGVLDVAWTIDAEPAHRPLTIVARGVRQIEWEYDEDQRRWKAKTDLRYRRGCRSGPVVFRVHGVVVDDPLGGHLSRRGMKGGRPIFSSRWAPEGEPDPKRRTIPVQALEWPTPRNELWPTATASSSRSPWGTRRVFRTTD